MPEKIGKHYEANYNMRVDALTKFFTFADNFNNFCASKFN